MHHSTTKKKNIFKNQSNTITNYEKFPTVSLEIAACNWSNAELSSGNYIDILLTTTLVIISSFFFYNSSKLQKNKRINTLYTLSTINTNNYWI